MHWKAKSGSLKTALNRYLESPVFHTVNEKYKLKGHTPPRYGGDEHEGTHSQRQTQRHLEESRVDVTSRLSQTKSVCVCMSRSQEDKIQRGSMYPKWLDYIEKSSCEESSPWDSSLGWGAGYASQYICSDGNRHLSLLFQVET